MTLCARVLGKWVSAHAGRWDETSGSWRVVSSRCERTAKEAETVGSRGGGAATLREPDSVCAAKFSYQIADARSFYYSSSLIKVLFLVICVNGEYWHALGGRRLKASIEMLLGCYLQFVAGDFSLLTPPGGQRDLMYCVADFYLFHEKIIYILMPEPEVEYNFERTTPNRRCNINGRCCSSGTSADSWKSERLRSEVTTHGYDRKPPFRLSGASDSVRASKLPLPSDPRCYMGADEHRRGCSAFNKSGPGRWKPV